MIDDTTSFTLNLAFKRPGTNAHKAPAKAPTRTIRINNKNLGILSLYNNPILVAQNPPNNICPGVPILNNPVLKANATESPVKISGVAVAKVSPILCTFINPPLKRYIYPSTGLSPINNIKIAPAINPKATAITEFKASFLVML